MRRSGKGPRETRDSGAAGAGWGVWMDSQDSELNGDEKAEVGRRGQTTRGAVCSRDCGPELGEDDQQAEPKWKDQSQGCLRPSLGTVFRT